MTPGDGRVLRVAVCASLLEEGWPSMDLVAEQLVAHLDPRSLRATLVRPGFVRRFSRLGRRGRTVDWMLNRFRDYPRELRRLGGSFDFFHIADHSYSQLVNLLPPGRTGVFCHDLDAYRSVIEPAKDPRSFLFRALVRERVRGLGRASVVFTATVAVKTELERHGLVDPSRIVLAPYGVASEFFEVPDEAAAHGPPFVLHVGSCIPRKRIDVLLEVFARLRARRTELRLVQIGGTWTPEQRASIERLGIGASVRQDRGIDRRALARLYRTAAVILMPTEREGFGLPLVEALACGATVVASDLPVLREVGADAAVFCPVGDIDAWTATVDRLLADSASAPPRVKRLERARLFDWSAHARTIAAAYRRLLAPERA